MDPQTVDVLSKILIALVSAFAGVGAKTAVDRQRARVLLPFVLEQVRQTASLCALAFSPSEARAAAPVCDAAYKGLTQLITLGVSPTDTWCRGAERLLATSVQIAQASSETALNGNALDRLRQCGTELQTWLESTPSWGRRVGANTTSIPRAA